MALENHYRVLDTQNAVLEEVACCESAGLVAMMLTPLNSALLEG